MKVHRKRLIERHDWVERWWKMKKKKMQATIAKRGIKEGNKGKRWEEPRWRTFIKSQRIKSEGHHICAAIELSIYDLFAWRSVIFVWLCKTCTNSLCSKYFVQCIHVTCTVHVVNHRLLHYFLPCYCYCVHA